MPAFILALSCPDRRGIGSLVATVIANRMGNITEARQFDDLERGIFFMRVELEMDTAIEDFRFATHSDTPERLVRKGRDMERRVLARPVSLHLDDRVLMNGNETVVIS